MPLGLLNAYGEQLPRLQAEEQLSAIQVQVAASGRMKKPDLAVYLRSLRKQAQGGKRRKGKPATARQLASMKIKTEGG